MSDIVERKAQMSGAMGNCVLVGRRDQQRVQLRDSKDPTGTQVLRFADDGAIGALMAFLQARPA